MAGIRNPKDFGTGIMYVVFGGAAVYIAQDYGMGQASRMGPGYFPMSLGFILLVFGAVALIRSFLSDGEPIGAFAWKAIFLVCGSTVLFGLLLRPAGLIIALLGLALMSAAGSSKFRFEWIAVAALVVLVAFCSLVFVKGLGVPMPLLGTWFGEVGG